jgi:Na+-driven multidrug efflux pump
MALQFSITAIGSIILQTSVNTLGAIAVTSVTAAQKVSSIVMGPLESIGITMATYSGQNLGAGKYHRIREGIRCSLILSMCYCVFSIAFLFFLGKYTAYLFLDPSETEIIRLAVQYMRINALFYPALGVLFILRNALQGMGFSLMPMMAGVSELAARALICFGFVPIYGYPAAIMASPLAWVFADVLLISVYFYSMRKLKRKLIPNNMEMV